MQTAQFCAGDIKKLINTKMYTQYTMETTIRLDKKFKDWLKKQGKKGETYQNIIKRLIENDK